MTVYLPSSSLADRFVEATLSIFTRVNRKRVADWILILAPLKSQRTPIKVHRDGADPRLFEYKWMRWSTRIAEIGDFYFFYLIATWFSHFKNIVTLLNLNLSVVSRIYLHSFKSSLNLVNFNKSFPVSLDLQALFMRVSVATISSLNWYWLDFQRSLFINKIGEFTVNIIQSIEIGFLNLI